jgi:hypothetical protein
MVVNTEHTFWCRVLVVDDGCILFPGHTVDGYGRIRYRGRQYLAHVLAWILTYGDPGPLGPKHDRILCHTCDVRNCVNPDHLYIGINSDNVKDMYARSGIDVKARNAKAAETRRRRRDAAMLMVNTSCP